ncbi:hypothetical protein C9374_011372 [Naegleria lovaniensis]|uniref:HECT-type E3 ubiquitin transferase n=1 Tax=Naegleria lovaniensis TaxID=51637 RepID=A0AA88KQT7_NAELO|nr:uncharacterized protein C9374_011372 [Naegleria lovaniensis]KAG2392647.1 hypothetical protein C9374_011372 [Naegleria lovaniensis]
MPHKEGTKRKRNNKKPHQHNNKRKKKQHSQNSTATSSSVSQQGSNSSTSSTQQIHSNHLKNHQSNSNTLQAARIRVVVLPLHQETKRKKKKTSLHQQLTPLQKESVHSDQDISSSETSTHRSVIVNSSTPTITPVNENQNIASFTSVVSSSLSSPASSSSSSNRPSHWQVVRSLKGFKPKSKNKKNSKNTTPLFNNTTSSSTNSNSEQSSDQEEYFETDSESIMSENSSTQTNTFQSTLENIIQNYGHQIARGTAVPTEQLEEIIQGLKDYSDPTRQFDSVSELCNIIAISNEQTLSRMGIDRFIPELLNILSNNESYDLMVLSARTLLNTMDIYPASCSIVASNGGVNVISQKILSIEYIDLAELSIQMVEHLAHQYGSTLLQEGVLMASLTYIDFFGMDMQKKILRIASSLCKSISKSQYELACDVLPTISRFLSNSEHSMTDSAIFCLTRIVYPFLKDDEKLLNICNSSELLSHATEILSNDKASKNTISLMLKLLKSVSVCSQLVKDIYERGFMHLLTGLLSPERGLHECLIDTLYFILALLPKLPRKDELACQMSHSQRKKLLVRMTEVKPPNQSTIEEPNTPQDKLEALFTEQPTLLQTASEVLLEPLIHIFSSNQNDHVSNILLQIIGTIIYFSPSQMLVETLKDIPFSTFLASLLSSDDISRVSTALQISEILSCKLPSIFDMYFLREGVIHRIKAIGGREPNSSEEFLLDQMRKKTEETYQKAEQERKEKEERLKKEAIEKNEKIKNKSNNSQSSESETEEQYQDPEKISVSWVEPHVDIPKLPKLSRLYCEKHKKSSFKSSELVGYAVAKAQLIFDKYYERTKDVEMESKNFVKLKAIASSLEKTILAKDINVELEESLLLQIRELIISEDGISNFEFLNSGVAHAIYEYLSRKDGNRSVKERLFLFARILDEDLPKTAASLTRTRSKSFGNANDMLTAVSNTDNKSITANPTYLTELVKKLFDAFNSVENFNINVSETSSIASNVNAVINKLSKQFKLSLTDEQSKKVITLQVHPLARVREVGTFLISKAGETPKEEPEVLNSESTDTSYFHLTERDDDEFIGTVSTIDIETPASEADTSFLSADTMVDEEKSVKYVQLYLNGKLVDENSTLFSIFFKNSSSSSHPSNLNLADTTQNLTFKIVDTKEVHDSDVIMDTNTTLKTSKAESLVNSIIQHCNDNQKIQEENIEKDAIELLDLLKILNCLSKIAPILPHNEKNMKRVLVPSSMFLNPKLASKIVRYIQDPYYLFGDCFPSWLYMLMERYNFMFTFDVRQLYFDLTSKGIARAIQTIQNRFSKSRDRKTRLIQIGKQKVRLSRSPNILESAYKAFTSVETNRIVEFEFKDEVGTGTGPTTELYSLVSRDLQQQGLSIFKDDFVGEHEEKEKFSRLVETKTGLYPNLRSSTMVKLMIEMRIYFTFWVCS